VSQPSAGGDEQRLRPQQSRALRWTFGVVLAIVVALGLVLLFLLTLATRNRALYEQNFGWLVAINVVWRRCCWASSCGSRCAWPAVQARQVRQPPADQARHHGLVGFLPGLLIYVVSYQFVSRSIESWFDVQVESALEAGSTWGAPRSTSSPAISATAPASRPSSLQDTPDAWPCSCWSACASSSRPDDILWSGCRTTDRQRGRLTLPAFPERPSPAQLRKARSSGCHQIEGLEEGSEAGAGGGAHQGDRAGERTGLACWTNRDISWSPSCCPLRWWPTRWR
jgi:hypothetical protein